LRQRADADETRAALVRHHRNAGLGKLTASILHEVNDPLAYVISNLQQASLAVSELGGALDTSHLKELLHDALEGMQRIRHVADELRGFAQGTALDMETADLNRVVEIALQIIETDSSHRVRVEFHAGDIPAVRCHRYQLALLFLHLLENAVEALGESGVVHVTTSAGPTWIDAEVGDTGPGIPEDELERVFEPLYTTKKERAGLGLAISREIATAHGGSLKALPGRGARFLLRIPVARHAL
jgi:signal transduction histidine kinase